MQAIPRRNIIPLVKSLIADFGSYAEVISPLPKRLLEFSGVGENVITTLKLAEASGKMLTQDKVMEKPILSNWQALINYCKFQMAYKKNEQFRVLLLDR